MKKIVTGLLLSITSIVAIAQEPVNLADAKQRLIAYYTPTATGPSLYEQESATVIGDAQTYLAQRVNAANPQAKLAIVFDIDDTLLWRYPYNKSVGFGYQSALFEQHQLNDIDPLVPHIKALYDYALQHQVAIFIVTAGCEHIITGETKNLRADGLSGWQAIYARPDAVCRNPDFTSKAFKTAKRLVITQKGYDIAVSIGDQTSDLGQWADRNFKLPNPMYRVT